MKTRKLSAAGLLSIGFITGILWVVSCGGSSSVTSALASAASDITYSNTTSGLTATTVQAALDEVVSEDAANARAAVDSQDLTFGDVIADSFTLGAVKTGYFSIAGAAFTAAAYLDANDNYSTDQGDLQGNAVGATSYFASVNIPHGATITEFDVYILDNDALESATVRLMSYSLDGSENLSEITSVTSDDDTDLRSIAGLSTTVDNDLNAYLIKADLPASTSVDLTSAKVTYTYTSL